MELKVATMAQEATTFGEVNVGKPVGTARAVQSQRKFYLNIYTNLCFLVKLNYA
jgi:hypothetical protein